jgi:ribonuclease HI
VTFQYTVWTDGAARGRINGTGPASCGFVVRDIKGIHIYSAAWAIGHRTNNFSEYQGLIRAANWVLRNLPFKDLYVHFLTDSELMQRQLTGVYSVKHPEITPLFHEAMAAIIQLQGYKVEWIRRELNTEADEICNRVLDAEKEKGILFVEDKIDNRPTA